MSTAIGTTKEKVGLTAERETALITLVGKARQSASADPILPDPWAEAAVERVDYDFAKLKVRDYESRIIAIRSTEFDALARSFIAEHPDAVVLGLGCGLDSRVFRVDPPATVAWLDIDFADVVDLRRRLFPEREGYSMVGAPVGEPGWLDSVPTDRPVIALAEGLSMYLDEPTMRRLLNDITGRFPSGRDRVRRLEHDEPARRAAAGHQGHGRLVRLGDRRPGVDPGARRAPGARAGDRRDRPRRVPADARVVPGRLAAHEPDRVAPPREPHLGLPLRPPDPLSAAASPAAQVSLGSLVTWQPPRLGPEYQLGNRCGAGVLYLRPPTPLTSAVEAIVEQVTTPRLRPRPRAPAAAAPGSTRAAPSSPRPPWTARSPGGA